MPSSGCQTRALDRKSTRLNSSHTIISYAVFCLKKHTSARRFEHGTPPAPFYFLAEVGLDILREFSPECTLALQAEFFFFLMMRRPPISPPFPTPPLFR